MDSSPIDHPGGYLPDRGKRCVFRVLLLLRMAQPNSILSPPHAAPPEPMTEELEETSWSDIVDLLRQAAELAAASGAETDRFMQAAWLACLDARPGLREELEDKELRAQLKKLRKRGLIADA
jgi:hypothetical protein